MGQKQWTEKHEVVALCIIAYMNANVIMKHPTL